MFKYLNRRIVALALLIIVLALLIFSRTSERHCALTRRVLTSATCSSVKRSPGNAGQRRIKYV